MNTRRKLLVVLAAAALPQSLFAQARKEPLRIAYFSEGTLEKYQPYVDSFREGLRELGYQEGKNVRIDYYWRGDTIKVFRWMASDIVSSKPDVIVTTCEVSAIAAKNATTTIPIVMAAANDPVTHGLVAGLARPGGNVTGVSNNQIEISAKRLELLKDLMPSIARVAMLYWKEDPPTEIELSALRRTAVALHMELLRFEAEDERGFERVFGEMRKAKVQAVIDYSGTTVNFPFRRQVTELSTRAKLPTVFYIGELVDDGGLMSYGPNVREGFRTAASYVDRIAKGRKPAELPVQQPTRFELVINLRTAKAIGVTVPQSLLVRADRIIE